jgi:hypothetical protein
MVTRNNMNELQCQVEHGISKPNGEGVLSRLPRQPPL